MLCRTIRFLQMGQMGSGGASGGPVYGLAGRMRASIEPTIDPAALDQAALEVKMNSLLAQEMEEDHAAELDVPLPRKWVKAPMSALSTSLTRRDWFRMMNFNMLTDSWSDPAHRTTPVENVHVRVPSFTRDAAAASASDSNEEEFCNYDPAVDKEVPPFLSPESRRKHLVTLLRQYDPDIVCLNEVNRPFFFTEMWRYVRFLGYGNLYQSSRGARVPVMRRGEKPGHPRSAGKIPEGEDIGNVVLFHKGRFFPLMMPGRDIGHHFHFVHFVGMRDKVTNMTIYVACVQLTAGDTDEAVAVREHEAKQVVLMLAAFGRNDSDRSHMTTMVCGDLNNTTDDEPCVEVLRNRYFSTYDLVGGPRWTAWHYRNPTETRYGDYFRKNVEEMQRSSSQHLADQEVRRFTRGSSTANHGKSSRVRLVREEVNSPQYPWIVETHLREVPASPDGESEAKVDQLALVRENMEAQGIVYRAQDFMFYDPRTLALHQVLDVPDDDQVDIKQLFPNTKLPSHHLPLLVDVSFNDGFPDVAATSLKN